MKNNLLLIFVKEPVPGLVKTRLHRFLGPEGSAEAYRLMAETLFGNLSSLENVEIKFDPPNRKEAIRLWVQRFGWRISPQKGRHLGQRLFCAAQEALAAGNEQVLIIGSDCPYVTRREIQAAWKNLKQADLVLGPANDGGYWLIGLKKVHPELFRDIDWSTRKVLSQTLAIGQILGLKVSLLKALDDIDTPRQWKEFQRKRKRHSFKKRARRTVAPGVHFLTKVSSKG